MRRTLILALPLAAALALAPSAPAKADFGFSVFGGFRVGGIHFELGLHRGGPHAAHGYYYRTPGPVRSPGYRCGSACYRNAGVAYHHAHCPVVLHHFRAHRFAPPVFGPYGFEYDSRYRPYWDGGYAHRYDGRAYRWDWRYDRRYRGHPHGPRWHGRHGYGSHRHDDRCWDDRRRWDDRRYRGHDDYRDRRWRDDRDRDRWRGRASPRYPE